MELLLLARCNDTLFLRRCLLLEGAFASAACSWGSSRPRKITRTRTLLIAGSLLIRFDLLWAFSTRTLLLAPHLGWTLRSLRLLHLRRTPFGRLKQPAHMRLQEQEQHLLLVEGGVLHIAYRIVMLNCALIQFDEFG